VWTSYQVVINVEVCSVYLNPELVRSLLAVIHKQH